MNCAICNENTDSHNFHIQFNGKVVICPECYKYIEALKGNGKSKILKDEAKKYFEKLPILEGCHSFEIQDFPIRYVENFEEVKTSFVVQGASKAIEVDTETKILNSMVNIEKYLKFFYHLTIIGIVISILAFIITLIK